MLKKSLVDSWSFFKNHIIAISIIILPIVIPLNIITSLYQYFYTSKEFFFIEQIIPAILGIIAYPIYAVGIVFFIASVISREIVDTKTLWKLGLKFWLPYTILCSLILFTVISGLILLIVPGFIFIIRYTFSEFELLLNQSKPLDAMKNSWYLTKNYMWLIFRGYAVITIILFIPYNLVDSIFDESSISYWVLYTLSNITYSVFSVLYTIFAFRIYEISRLENNIDSNEDLPSENKI